MLLFQQIILMAQPDGYILTPKGNSIEYYITSLGDTALYRSQGESLISSNGWDATLDAPATGRYNCHSYTWNVSENGSERWLNAWYDGDIDYYNDSVTPTNTPTNIIEYWTNNGGYHNISNKIAKSKVYYGSHWVWEYTLYGWRWSNEKDHSGVVDSNTSYFISKWGRLPRYKHKPSHCPYVSSSLSYYKLDAPTVSGIKPAICNNTQRTFTSDITDANFNYNWSITSPLTEVSGDGTPSYRVASGSQDGQSALGLSITTPSGVTVSTNKSVWVGVPSTGTTTIAGGYISYPSPFPCIYTYGQRYGVHLNGYMDGVTQGYQWSGLAQYITDYGTGATFYPMNQGSPYYGSGYIQVVGKNQCGSSVPVAAGYGPCGYYMLFPNPADDYVEITTRASLENDNTNEATATAEIFEEGVVKIYNSFGNLLQTDEIETNWQRFSTSHLKEGVYIVEISTKSHTERLQLVVKH